MAETIEKQLETLKVEKDHIIKLTGHWDSEELIHFSKIMEAKGFNNILIVIPDDKDLEAVPVDDLW